MVSFTCCKAAVKEAEAGDDGRGGGGNAETVSAVELDDNEGATCVSLVRFDTAGYAGTYLAVGTAQGLSFNPRQADGEAREVSSSRHCVQQLTALTAHKTGGMLGPPACA